MTFWCTEIYIFDILQQTLVIINVAFETVLAYGHVITLIYILLIFR
jgi:hypothetical protein